MDQTRRLTLSEFEKIFCTDENLARDESRLSSISTIGESYSFTAPAPSDSSVVEFKERSYTLSCGASDVTSSREVQDKHDLNWCSIDDYVLHWSKLGVDEKHALASLVASDTCSNANRYGVKKRNLESHLLLSVGCDMTNILNSGYDCVLSNLKFHGDYNSNCAENRSVDPKTCVRAYKRFNKTFSVERLFELGLVAFQAVVSSDSSYRSLSGGIEAKERFHEFFRSSALRFSKLCSRRGLALSYVYSNEVSVDSILKAEYRPHTHIIFFVEASKNREEAFNKAELFASEFNKNFTDRVMTLDVSEIDSVSRPRMSTKMKDISTSFEYLFRAYSLADQYLREIRPENVRELNKKTVECYHNLVWLFKGADACGGKSVRRFNSSFVPKRTTAHEFEHPLLQKEKKSNKIKNTLQKHRPPMNAQAILKQAIDAKMVPTPADFQRASSRTSKPAKPALPVQGFSPSPEMPWAGQRGTMEDLGSFGLSPDEFFGGGGRLMFSDTKPVPAPVQSVQATQPIMKSSEARYLSHLRSKLASSSLDAEQIASITSSRASFEEAFKKEAELVWEGLKFSLEKSGANEDFVLGILKEAEEASPVNLAPPAVQPPRLDDTGLPADRHRVLPFMGNNLLGAAGGALLGSLVGNEMGLEGPASWLAPVLGGVAGHQYFPHMLNRWKDSYGEGVNKINEGAASFNNLRPFNLNQQTSTQEAAQAPAQQQQGSTGIFGWKPFETLNPFSNAGLSPMLGAR